ncbi:hypothetical protein BC832DRAFT_544249 [Gaertneriomyces semiglobifer]|nr:hypothetical protein BC832DRAFT_544249 [Gaertneriomyces semiglobifer]
MFLDFFTRHRELKRVSKYTKRRSPSSAAQEPASSPTATIPRATYDWNAPDTRARHAAEYYAYNDQVEWESRARRRELQLQRNASFASSTGTNTTNVTTSTASVDGPTREGILIVLDDTPEPSSSPARAAPQYSYADPHRSHLSNETRGAYSMDVQRNTPHHSTLSRSRTTKSKSPWWKKNRPSTYYDADLVRSSEEYNQLDYVPTIGRNF